jgi:hypothetical protein
VLSEKKIRNETKNPFKLNGRSLAFFINKCIDVSIFPDKLKTAQVRLLFKKKNILEKGNYPPVSVLPTISKFVERAIFDQLTDFFNFHFHPLLSALKKFRKGFGCQTALLKIIEDWKKALDENKYIAAILMDLSKAFDGLPHDLIVLKPEAYGLSERSINLLNSYLSGRKQCVKVKTICSSFETVYKGVPQGSILGPILFKFLLMTSFTLLILVLYIIMQTVTLYLMPIMI